MARPRQPVATLRVDIVLSLRPGEDDDLIDWFGRLLPRERSLAVKTRLRTGIGETTAPCRIDEAAADVLDGLLF